VVRNRTGVVDMLTRKQYELLLFINHHLNAHGVSPSFDEMKEALSLKSKSGIHRLITGLTERGFIRRLPHRARALEVLRLPENARDHQERPNGGQPGFAPTVIEGHFGARLTGASADGAVATDAIEIPLYGRIAAGLPIEALRDHSTRLSVPVSMLGKGDHYALEVAGDSMIDAGILDGDTVIIRRTDMAENGDIVVALVDDSEVTLKRFRRRGHSIALEPANPAHETRIFGPDQVRVQGRLIGLYRSY
jgi:repressor LexA